MSREPDIAARLRDIYATHPMVMEAADEIERLRGLSHTDIVGLRDQSRRDDLDLAERLLRKAAAEIERLTALLRWRCCGDAVCYNEDSGVKCAALEPKP